MPIHWFTAEGYVKEVDLDQRMILICDNLEDVYDEESWGYCWITVVESTIFSDGRSLDSIKQGGNTSLPYAMIR